MINITDGKSYHPYYHLGLRAIGKNLFLTDFETVTRMRKKIFLLSLLIAFLASCERDSLQNNLNPLDGRNLDNERVVRAGETDDALRQLIGASNPQYAYSPISICNQKSALFIILPGTMSQPKDYRLILQEAAKNGYHSIGIDYTNRQTVKSICDNSSDNNCPENTLNEYLTGENSSGDVSVSKAESFENRISKMLLYLSDQYPEDHWAQFLTAEGEVNWGLVSLAGHSQGGTHALYISKKRQLLRAAFFSSPYGFEVGGVYPEWLTEAGLTSSKNLYAFNHRGDKLLDWNEVNRTWDAIGLDNDNLLIDVHKDFNSYHRFYTQISNGLGLQGGTHGSTCTDSDTPKDRNRNPKFKEVWKHMCFP